MTYLQLIKRISDLMCPVCSGRGVLMGTSSENVPRKKWLCMACNGTGFADGGSYVIKPKNERVNIPDTN